MQIRIKISYKRYNGRKNSLDYFVHHMLITMWPLFNFQIRLYLTTGECPRGTTSVDYQEIKML